MLFVIGSYYTFLKSLDVLHGSVSDFPKTWTWLVKPFLNFTTTTTNWLCGKCSSHVLNYTTIQLQLTIKHSLLIQLTSWDFFSHHWAPWCGNVFFPGHTAQRRLLRMVSGGFFLAAGWSAVKPWQIFSLCCICKAWVFNVSHKALGWRNFNERRVGDVVSVQQFIIGTPCVFVQVFTIRLSSNYIYCIISLQELRWEVFQYKSGVWEVIEIE